MFEAIIYEGIKIVESRVVGGSDVRHAKDCKAEFGIRKLARGTMKKQLILLTLFVVLLNSCAPNASQNVTVTSEVTVTSIFTPAPTTTSTITPTPSDTPDPNKPADATGKDANGYYKDMQENGNTVRYHDTTITDSNGKRIYRGWLASDVQNGRMNNGNSMPLNTIIDAESIHHNVMPWSVYKSSLVANSIPLFKQNQYVDDPSVIRTSRTIIPQIYDNRRKNLSNLDMHGFVMAMLNGDPTNSAYGFSYKDNSYIWLDCKGYTFNWLSVEEIKKMSQYWETTDELNKDLIYYWTVIVVPDGTLVGFGAVDNPKKFG